MSKKRRRIIEDTLVFDEDLNLCSDFAQLVYLKLLTQTDDWGRTNGRVSQIRAKIEPLKESASPERYHSALEELAVAGLICVYDTPDLSRVLQYKPSTFERINKYFIKQRLVPEYPEYTKECKMVLPSDEFPFPPPPPKVPKIPKTKESPYGDRKKIPPEEAWVVAYGTSIGLSERESMKWLTRNEMIGWKTGHHPIVDWQSSMRMWVIKKKEFAERDAKENQNGNGKKTGASKGRISDFSDETRPGIQ